MANPLVSIGIPTRNRAALLRESLCTIRAQDYAPLEILISDDASTDGTEELCREIARQDARVRYVKHSKPLGCYANHNFCIEQTNGDFLCLFHDDDQHHPELVKESAAFLMKHPEVGLVCSDWDLLDETGKVVGTRVHDVPEIMAGLDFIGRTIRSGQTSVGIPGAMMRRSALGSVRFREDGPLGYADFVVWFHIAERAAIGHIPRRLWQYRLVPQSVGHQRIVSMIRDYDDQLSLYCDGHLEHFPEHRAIVAGWRRDIKRYIYWALLYELGLHSRKEDASPARARYQKTVFEVRAYRLTREELTQVLEQLRRHRAGILETLVYFIVVGMISLHLTRPLAWATYRHPWLRQVLGLK